MKTKVLFFLIFGLLFLHPTLTPASSRISSSVLSLNSSQNSQLVNSGFSDESKIQNILFVQEFEFDDDEDFSFSTRKKNHFENRIQFKNYLNSELLRNRLFGKLRSSLYIFQYSKSHFISLRVFKI